MPFAQHLLAWYDRHGRHDLPWQRNPTPYRVWISEIMLQQTRVTTVIPYFERFVTRFPEVDHLAAAPLDEVLALWSGLGYYARARHLHRAATEVVTHYGGRLPTDLNALRTLPGIGRSTAAAILTLAMGAHHAILDGNVKRVLGRYHAISGWPGDPKVEQQLWTLAESHAPRHQAAAYTQAIMDLGATLCTRARPACARCPVADNCRARILGRSGDFPGTRPQRALPVREITFLLLLDATGAVLLERRPLTGIWGGLWTFPECPLGEIPIPWLAHAHGLSVTHLSTWEPLRHTLTHLHLDITPWLGRLQNIDPRLEIVPGNQEVPVAGAVTLWYNPHRDPPGGLAAPVARLLARLGACGLSSPPLPNAIPR
ncbi:adenine DNA glycosylase [Gammaproteobacteria bacterium]